MCVMLFQRLRSATHLPSGTARAVGLLGVSGAAWLITAHLATADMRLGILTDSPTLSSHSQMDTMSPMPLGAFLGSWTVMMVAMMAPSLWPAVGAFNGAGRIAKRSRGATALFITGYFLLWGAIGIVAYAVLQALQAGFPPTNPHALQGGAALLIVAGLYQFTSLKRACLRQCRAPHARLRRGVSALRAGFVQGMYCLGSSWPLMLSLLLLGMMNLAWMGVIAVMIFVEKVAPKGHIFGRVIGLGSIGLGIVLLITLHPAPALLGIFTRSA